MMPVENAFDPQQVLSQIRELFAKKTSGVIVLPQKPSEDAISAACALYLGLLKMGKQVSIACSDKPKSAAIGADKIQNSLESGGDSLVVSFPYEEGSIDKVDYKIDNNKFNLVIIPRTGFKKVQPNDVEFSYTGAKLEFIVCIDVPNLNSIGSLYQKHEKHFSSSSIINIDRHLINNNFGAVNYVVKNSSSVSELALQVLYFLKTEIDKDMATNLYAGISAATNSFTSYSTNADTFLALSHLLKMGAIKRLPNQSQFMNNPGTPFMPTNMAFNNPFMAKSPATGNFNSPDKHPSFNPFMPLENVEKDKLNDNFKEDFDDETDQIGDLDSEEVDTLKPKISLG